MVQIHEKILQDMPDPLLYICSKPNLTYQKINTLSSDRC
ncbi:hypothetical protein B0I27_101555 [Arcticibacter pallidicorallinus]|uniref:Uncharacterized protein n=1 Tax=Arcticibacter pallidicorallinus TaxID=1259464 RepID=A0A2T0UCA9_9SPHI|nr:hypothetical protein B0I27_101555 [Arcticibacter pallidicorallinus]